MPPPRNEQLNEQLAQAEQCLQRGDAHSAGALLQQIIAGDPTNGKAHELLGYIAGNEGRTDVSFEHLKIAVAAAGATPQAHYFLGKHQLERSLFADAAGSFQQALNLNGAFFEGLHDLGVALTGSGQSAEALTALDQALALRHDVPDAWYNKAVALDNLKRLDEALACYDKAVGLAPEFAPAWANRGSVLNDLGRFTEALTSHEFAIKQDPGNAMTWSNRGATLFSLSRTKEALESHQKAVALNPQYAEAWAKAGGIYIDIQDYRRALEHLTKAYALAPDAAYILGDLLRARIVTASWNASSGAQALPEIEAQIARALSDIDAGRKVAAPFISLAMPASAQQLRRCAETYTADRCPAIATTTPSATSKAQRIRIGYFSADFRQHAVSYLTAGLFEHHDRSRFEVHTFAFGVSNEDAMSTRIRTACEHYHDVSAMHEAEIAQLARSIALDIAVDLTGHTQGARTGIFARRAAPVQINYLGLPGTMGAPFMDYLIADDTVLPAHALSEISEKAVWLPHCFQINDNKREIAPTPERAACGLPPKAFVLCSFNSAYKLTPLLFDVWLDILREAPNSVLWLIGDNELRKQNLRARAARQDIAPERLNFADMLPYAGHLARYGLADLVLDTLPFNGGTSTSDALWGGAPVLTCQGNTYAGRMSASLLNAVGLPELIAPNLDAYRDIAIDLATHPAQAAALKQKLLANRNASPLFDTASTTRYLEAAYGTMVERLRAGLLPDHLRIPA